MFVGKKNKDICLPQGSRGIRGPQGAVGKKGDNVSQKKKKKGGKKTKHAKKTSTDGFGRFDRVFQGLTGKMAHQGFLE